TAGAVGRVPQGAPVQRLQHLHPGPARVRHDASGAPGALRAAGRVLPGQARPLPRTARDHAAAPPAGARRLFPAGRLLGGERPGRRRVLPLAHDREGRGRDPAVAVLRCAAGRAATGAAVLRQARGHPGQGDRTPAKALAPAGGPGRSYPFRWPWARLMAMDNRLRIALVQGATRWHDPEGNREYYGGLIAPLAGTTDVVLLPETFTSGFSNDAIERAETMDGPTVGWMREHARRHDAALCGSVQLLVDGKVHNRPLLGPHDGAVV